MSSDFMTSVMKSEANGPDVAEPAATAPASAAATCAEGGETDWAASVLSFCAGAAEAGGRMLVAPVATAAARKRRRSGLGNGASASSRFIKAIPRITYSRVLERG